MRILVLRHGNRFEIKSPNDAPKTGLTMKGKINAFRMGKWLSKEFKNTNIITSFVQRCYETGEWMNKSIMGAIRREDIASLVSLGYIKVEEYTPWLYNFHYPSRDSSFKERFEHWEKLGYLAYSFEEYGKLFEAMITDIKGDRIIVTHDSIIGPFMEYLWEKMFFDFKREYSLPRYLSGFEAVIENKEIIQLYWIKLKQREKIWEK